jgi:hypothetical protein
MVALECKNCGSNNFDQYAGIFICQNCQTVYQDDNYKKIDINKKVTKKNDYTDEYNTAIANGRRSLSNGDWNGVREYYHEARGYNSRSLEALLYEPFAKVVLTADSPDMNLRNTNIAIFRNSISAVSNLWKYTPDNEQIIKYFADDLERFGRFKFLQFGKPDRNGYRKEFYKPLYQPCADILMEFIKELDEISGKEFDETLDRLLIKEINLLFNIKKAKFKTKIYNKLLEKVHARLKENVPDYEVPAKIKRYSRKQVSLFAKLIAVGVIFALYFLYHFINFVGRIATAIFS